MRRSQKRTRKNKYNAKTINAFGTTFHSKAEYEYYMLLKNNNSVKDIVLQPEFDILEPYTVTCGRCQGIGRITNEKTHNLNKCSLCKGKGSREKSGSVYTADFKVTYADGRETVVDVKGGPVSKDFTLRRKLFEIKTGKELVIAKKSKRGWEVK